MKTDNHGKEKYDDYKNYVNQLQGEYKTTFEKIEVYINDNFTSGCCNNFGC